MRPTDLSTERTRRAHKRFAATVRLARLAATPQEACDLGRIVTNASTGVLPLEEAHEFVRGLQRDQQGRAAA